MATAATAAATGAAPLFLIGPRGCGKSTVGLLTARALGRAFCDTDSLVAEESGCDIAAIVEREGWEGFRRRESRALAAASRGGAVVATGGGAVLDEENRRLMRASGLVVYLAAPVDTLRSRLCDDANGGQRPSLTGGDPLEEIAGVLAQREALYLGCAHHCLEASAPAHDVAEKLIRLLREKTAAQKDGA